MRWCFLRQTQKKKSSRRLWRSRRRKSRSVPEGGADFQQQFPCWKMPKPWHGHYLVLPENRRRLFQQHRNLPENFSSKEFWTATAFSSFLSVSNNVVDFVESLSLKKQPASSSHYHDIQNDRRFRKGVGGRGLATNKPPKRAQKVLLKCVPILLRGHRKKGTEKRPEFLVFEGFPRGNPLCPPTPFRNF